MKISYDEDKKNEKTIIEKWMKDWVAIKRWNIGMKKEGRENIKKLWVKKKEMKTLVK